MTTIIDGTAGITFPNSTVQASAGQVLQVISVTKTDTFTTTSTSFTDLTGLSVSIAPKFSNSKIFVTYSLSISASTGIAMGSRILRDATAVGVADAAGTRTRATNIIGVSSNSPTVSVGQFLDSPATTSATVYKIQVGTNTGTLAVNRNWVDSDSSAFDHGRSVSTITVMEIAA